MLDARPVLGRRRRSRVPGEGGACRSLAWAVGAIATVLTASAGHAYNEGGHFYTVTALEYLHRPAFDGVGKAVARRIAFCAQLPDLSKEYDAVTLRTNLLGSKWNSTWGLFSACFGADVRHMVVVHHYLHALTGTSAEPVTKAAREILGSLRSRLDPDHPDPNQVCAMGFAAHLLGDSYSHRRIDAPDRMYPTGLGHFRDQHHPDEPLFSCERISLWKDYVSGAGPDLDSPLDDGRRVRLLETADHVVKEATERHDPPSDANDWKEAVLIEGLRATLRDGSEDGTPVWAAYNPPLEQVARNLVVSSYFPILKTGCEDMLPLFPHDDSNQTWSCNETWRVYLGEAIKAFAANKIPASCAPD